MPASTATFIEADLLAEEVGVYTVARLHFLEWVGVEITCYLSAGLEGDDLDALRYHVPNGSVLESSALVDSDIDDSLALRLLFRLP